MKLFTMTLAIASTALLFSEPALSRGARGDRGDSGNFAIDYCNYDKNQANFAGRKARANPGVRKYANRAYTKWATYNRCLKKHGWHTAYRPPVY